MNGEKKKKRGSRKGLPRVITSARAEGVVHGGVLR